MKMNLDILNLKTIVRVDEIKPTAILIISVLLLAIHRYFGSIEFANATLPRLSDSGSAFYMFLSAFILFGLIPFAIVRYAFHERVRDYGITMGDWKTGLAYIAIIFPIIAIALLYPASQTQEMRSFYPLVKTGDNYMLIFTRVEILRVVLFYTAWEFFFRGFMLFGLRNYVGDWMAICIQTIPSCLWHIGCPSGELFSSIAAGILFGLIALRTRSIVWSFFLHLLIGITVDLLIIFT